MAIRTIQPNAVIFREGETGETFYQVLTGKVSAYINYGTDEAQTLTVLGPGEFFGELAMLGSIPRTATIVAGGAGATLLELTWDTMVEVFQMNPSIILTLMRHIARRTAALSADCEEAHKTLSAVKAASAEPVNPSLLDKAKVMVSYLFGFGKANNGPSLEEKMAAKAGKEISEGFSKHVFSCDKGTVLYREGDAAACMYTIHYGSVEVYSGYGTDDQRLITELYVNGFFGEIGMLCDIPRTATIVARENGTTLEIIKPEDLSELFEKNPSKIWMILEHMVLRLRNLTDEYADVCGELSKLI